MENEDQGRDIHTAGGGACTDHQTDTGTDHDTCTDGGQHGIHGQDSVAYQSSHHLKCQRIVESADDGGDGKLFAQDPGAQQEHGYIEDGDEKIEWQPDAVLEKQTQTGGAAGDQTDGENKQDDTQSVGGVADEDQQNG